MFFNGWKLQISPFQNLSKALLKGIHSLGLTTSGSGVSASPIKHTGLNIGEHEAMGCMTFRTPSPVAK
jgi:hypothetical protein